MKNSKKHILILASGSPRRKEILTKMGLSFKIIPSDFEEVLDSDDFNYEKIEELSYQKAKAVLKHAEQHSLIIGADTVVVLNKTILGKPKDEKQALEMLNQLSGQQHSVVTSICIINSETLDKKILSTTSYVEFEYLSDEKINHYVQNFKPLDKAGAYGIQELPKGFIKNVEGSFENIIGLCPASVSCLLRDFNFMI